MAGSPLRGPAILLAAAECGKRNYGDAWTLVTKK
jgi:hypothetical protein